MKVLIACEESQEVCKAFRNLGHEAYSCDVMPCSGGNPDWHIKADVLTQLNSGWDLMIAHPPCTHLSVSGARHFKKKIASGEQQEGIDFFMALINADIPMIAVENPICIMSSKYRKPDQIIQPYEHGHSVSKSTCLWLKGLPKLKPTKIVDKGEFKEWIDKNGKKKRQHLWYYNALRQKNTGALRSKTFPGIAKAMAEQWSNPVYCCFSCEHKTNNFLDNCGCHSELIKNTNKTPQTKKKN